MCISVTRIVSNVYRVYKGWATPENRDFVTNIAKTYKQSQS